MRRCAGLMALLSLAACMTPEPPLAGPRLEAVLAELPAGRPRVVVMPPTVAAASIALGGDEEARPDWTATTGESLSLAFADVLRGRGCDVVAAAKRTDGEAQLALLAEAVESAILDYSAKDQAVVWTAVPTKAEALDFTLGARAAVGLAAAYDADFALFTSSRASYASGGRFLEASLTSLLMGWSTKPARMLGTRWTRATLVDLRTGAVVWLGHDDDGDPRHRDGARAVAERVAAKLPLTMELRRVELGR